MEPEIEVGRAQRQLLQLQSNTQERHSLQESLQFEQLKTFFDQWQHIYSIIFDLQARYRGEE